MSQRNMERHSIKNGRETDSVDAGPFLEWLERWRAYQDQMRYDHRPSGRRAYWAKSTMFGADSYVSQDRSIATLGDLADLAGVSEKVFRRARQGGRITVGVVDRVLVAAGGDTLLSHLYPDLDEESAA